MRTPGSRWRPALIAAAPLALVLAAGGLLGRPLHGPTPSGATSDPVPTVERATAAPTDTAEAPPFAGIAQEPAFAPARAAFVDYQVQAGDVLWQVAERFQLRPETILWTNRDLDDPDLLLVGQTLRIPPVDGVDYTVRLGDSLAGRQLAQSSIPLIVVVRKALGPLMLVLGLHLLRLLPLRFGVGFGHRRWVEARAGSGAAGAFLLGTAFSLAFCPTLFLLFFGLTIPLALASPAGALYPAAFALGTTLPLLGLAALLAAGVGTAKRAYVRGARRLDAWLRPAAGVLLLLAGLNDTLVYWFV